MEMYKIAHKRVGERAKTTLLAKILNSLPERESERWGHPESYMRGLAVGHNQCLDKVIKVIEEEENL